MYFLLVVEGQGVHPQASGVRKQVCVFRDFIQNVRELEGVVGISTLEKNKKTWFPPQGGSGVGVGGYWCGESGGSTATWRGQNGSK